MILAKFAWKRLLCVALASAVATFAVGWWWHCGRPLREAAKAYEAEDYLLSLRWANYHLRQVPRDTEAMRFVARSLARMGGDDPRAIEFFLQIPELHAEDFVLLGICYSRNGEYIKAVEPLRQALALQPSADAHRALAAVYGYLERVDFALEHARKLTQFPEGRRTGLALQGQLYFMKGKHRESFEAYQQLLKENPKLAGIPQNHHTVILNQVESLLTLGEYVQAGQFLRQLGSIAGDARALKLRARLRQRDGDYGQAEQDLRAAQQLQPHNYEILVELGQVLAVTGNFESSIEFLKTAVTLDLENPIAHQHLATSYARIGNQEAARQHQTIARRLRLKQEALSRADGD